MTLLSKNQEERFQDHGFLIFPKLFDNEEILRRLPTSLRGETGGLTLESIIECFLVLKFSCKMR